MCSGSTVWTWQRSKSGIRTRERRIERNKDDRDKQREPDEAYCSRRSQDWFVAVTTSTSYASLLRLKDAHLARCALLRWHYWDITAPFSERRTSALVLCIHKTSAAQRSSRATMGTLSRPSQCPLRHQSVLGDLNELRLALWKCFSAMQSPVWSQQSVTGA